MADNKTLENKAEQPAAENKKEEVKKEEIKPAKELVDVQYIKESNGVEKGFKRKMELADAEMMVGKGIVKILK